LRRSNEFATLYIMTTAVRAEYYVTPEAYLEAERLSDRKHEYLAGVIYAMSGTTADHNRIAMNISRSLGNQLAGKPCEVFSPDLKVRIRTGDAEFYYYPDATVDCGRPASEALYADEPRVIFEVMSRDSERTDRGEKLRNYQSLPSLDTYVLVDQFQMAVTIYRRIGPAWERTFFTEKDDLLDFPSIACQLRMVDVYDRTQQLT
jgi:Uma2 family endonuclease